MNGTRVSYTKVLNTAGDGAGGLEVGEGDQQRHVLFIDVGANAFSATLTRFERKETREGFKHRCVSPPLLDNV